MRKCLFCLGLLLAMFVGYAAGCGLGWTYHFSEYHVVRVRPLTGHVQILYLSRNGWIDRTDPDNLGIFGDTPDAKQSQP